MNNSKAVWALSDNVTTAAPPGQAQGRCKQRVAADQQGFVPFSENEPAAVSGRAVIGARIHSSYVMTRDFSRLLVTIRKRYQVTEASRCDLIARVQECRVCALWTVGTFRRTKLEK